ncbi:MAG: ABC transporter ATP-binding protein [Deltaproteobacteria bacterium]|nr:ABC transporter ATP-binding protein [Deltaproteobacteria bacterium]
MRRVSVLDVFSFVWSYWRQFPLRFWSIVAGVFLAVALEIQVPALAAGLLTSVERFADSGDRQGLASAWEALGWLVGLYVSVLIVQQGYIRIWLGFAAEIMQKLVLDGFHRVQRFSTDWHTNHFAGSTVRKVTRGMWAYDSLADIVVTDLGPPLLLLGGFSVAMFLREPVLGAAYTLAVIIFLVVSVAISLAYVDPANVVSNELDTEVGGALADSVTCNTVVKSFGAECREDARLDEVTGRWRRSAVRAWRRSMDAAAAQSLMLAGLLATLLGVVLWLFQAGRAGLADVVYVLTAYFVIRGHLHAVGWQVRNLQRAVNELEDLVDFSRTPPQVADAPDASALEAGPGRICFEEATFRYENQPEATFDGLSVRVAAREKVALVGESGAGKTTFVKLLQRLYDLEAGRIAIDGQDIAAVSQESLREAIALVPQEPILFHRSLAENISYGRPGSTREEIVRAARQAHAHEFISRLAAGYDTLVGERGIKLSGGERQRVAIARAILTNAPILILDEATSSLDSITERLIQDAIRNLMEGRTAILIAHRLSTIRRADRILVFAAGEIVEEGSHDDLMARPGGHYRRMFDMQTLGFVDDLAAREAG